MNRPRHVECSTRRGRFFVFIPIYDSAPQCRSAVPEYPVHRQSATGGYYDESHTVHHVCSSGQIQRPWNSLRQILTDLPASSEREPFCLCGSVFRTTKGSTPEGAGTAGKTGGVVLISRSASLQTHLPSSLGHKPQTQEKPCGIPQSFALQTSKNVLRELSGRFIQVGDYLFSRAVSSELSSAQVSLTSVFGMGTGGTSPSSTPTDLTGSVYHIWSTLSSIS